MNVTFGIQFNKKANCIRQRFVAIPATSSGQMNVKLFSLYANIVFISECFRYPLKVFFLKKKEHIMQETGVFETQ